jgi:NADH dehydrogenase ubiquinone Fe-S protein 4
MFSVDHRPGATAWTVGADIAARNCRGVEDDLGRSPFIAIPRAKVYTDATFATLVVPPMPARIFKPSKTAMQSGQANTKTWVIDYEPEQPRRVEPLMGWTSSGDMRQQLRLRFDSKEAAIAYCEREGIAYEVFDTVPVKRRTMSYADNFSFKRRDAWTH